MPVKPKARKCTTVYHTGPRAGQRCGWYAIEGSVHCKKHSGQNGRPATDRQIEALDNGRKKMWARLHEALAKGYITEYPQSAGEERKAKLRQNAAKARAARLERLAEAKALYPDAPPAKRGRRKGTILAAEHKAKIKATQKENARLKREAKTLARQEAKRVEKAAIAAQRQEFMAGARDGHRAEAAAVPRVMTQATRALMHERLQLPALPDKPFEQMEPHEKLTAITGMALDYAHELLTLKFDPITEPKIAALKWQAASGALSLRVKVDRNELASRKVDGMMGLLERLKGEKQPVTIEG